MSGSGETAEEAAESLDFEAWTVLSASLLKRKPEERRAILEARKIDPGAWRSSDERYCLLLADDISNDRMERPEVYAAACAAEMKRRKDAAASPAQPREPAPAHVPPEEASAAEGAPVIAAPGGLPTYMLVEAAAVSAPALAEIPAPPARVRSALGATVDTPDLASFARSIRAPMPFGEQPTSDVAAKRSEAEEPLPGDEAPGRATVLFGLPDAWGATAEPMPFGEEPSPAFVASMSAPSEPAAPAAQAGSALGETVPLGVDLLADLRGALPFLNKRAPAAPTAKLPALPDLTVEGYASFCAEMAVSPHQVAEIFARYGIADADARRAVDKAWHARFAAEPALQQRWADLAMSYRAWLSRRR